MMSGGVIKYLKWTAKLHKDRMASVRSPTINQKNPHYPQPGTEPRRLMFEDIPRSAPTPKKNGGTAPSKKNPPA
jgi:hypothetical protein